MHVCPDHRTARTPAQRAAQRITLVVLAVFILVPLSMLAHRAWVGPSYASAVGSITVVSKTDGVRFVFEVDGRTFEGRRARLIPVARGRYGVSLIESPAVAYRYVNGRHAVGDTVTVRYPPGDPSRAVLSVDVPPLGRWCMILAPFAVTLAFVGTMFFVHRSRNQT